MLILVLHPDDVDSIAPYVQDNEYMPDEYQIRVSQYAPRAKIHFIETANMLIDGKEPDPAEFGELLSPNRA